MASVIVKRKTRVNCLCYGAGSQQQGQGNWSVEGRINETKHREVFEDNLLQNACNLR